MTARHMIQHDAGTERYRIRYARGNGTMYDVTLFVTDNEGVCVVRNFEKLRPLILNAAYWMGDSGPDRHPNLPRWNDVQGRS